MYSKSPCMSPSKGMSHGNSQVSCKATISAESQSDLTPFKDLSMDLQLKLISLHVSLSVVVGTHHSSGFVFIVPFIGCYFSLFLSIAPGCSFGLKV